MAEAVFFRWKDSMSVKSEEIDNQHKKLVGMLNELYMAFINKEHKEKMDAVINQLIDYTRYHFDTEEKYFIAFRYPDKENHIKEHKQFKEKINEFVKDYKANSNTLTYKVINFLRDWLMNHIMVTDMKYVECFLQNGVR
jgi:hemerythrin